MNNLGTNYVGIICILNLGMKKDTFKNVFQYLNFKDCMVKKFS